MRYLWGGLGLYNACNAALNVWACFHFARHWYNPLLAVLAAAASVYCWREALRYRKSPV